MAALLAITELELRPTDTKNSIVNNFKVIFMKKLSLAYLFEQDQLQQFLRL